MHLVEQPLPGSPVIGVLLTRRAKASPERNVVTVWTGAAIGRLRVVFGWMGEATLGKAHPMRASIVSLSVVLAATIPASLLAASCSSTSGGGTPGIDGGGCSAYKSTADLTTPTVSFQKDVLPIFEHSCGLSSTCHGDPSDRATRGIFLGCDMSTSMSCTVAPPVAPQVYPQLVGAMADKPLETSMPFITPGDPSMSYLIHKMDDDLCTVTGCIAEDAGNVAVAQAGDTPGSVGPNQPPNWCGVFMPYNVLVLDPATRDTVRRWIKQGAMNN